MKTVTSKDDLKDGMSFTAEIDGTKCSGKISIQGNENIYLCQNEQDGSECDDKKGYKYSWLICYGDDEFESGNFDVINLMVESESEWAGWGLETSINKIETVDEDILLLL